jgi:hypothetical protein
MNGIIYGIREKSTGEIIYIGSTTKTLGDRRSNHLKACFILLKEDMPVYPYIRERCDKESFPEYFVFEPLFSGEFTDRTEVRKKEREYMEKFCPKCNKNRAYTSREEKAKENRERVKALIDTSSGYKEYQVKKSKEFFQDNPDYYAEWVKNNRDKKREASKRYRETHKDKLRERNRKWYEKQKMVKNT